MDMENEVKRLRAEKSSWQSVARKLQAELKQKEQLIIFLEGRVQCQDQRLDALRWKPVSEVSLKNWVDYEVCFCDQGTEVAALAMYIKARTVLAEDFLSEDCPGEFMDHDDKTDKYWTPEGFYEIHRKAEISYYISETITHVREIILPGEEAEE